MPLIRSTTRTKCEHWCDHLKLLTVTITEINHTKKYTMGIITQPQTHFHTLDRSPELPFIVTFEVRVAITRFL